MKIQAIPAKDHKDRYLGFINVRVLDDQGELVVGTTVQTQDENCEEGININLKMWGSEIKTVSVEDIK